MRHLLFIVLMLSISGHAENAAGEYTPRVQNQLREINYTVGDIARQRITIETPLGYRLDKSTLPKTGSRKAIEVRDVQASYQDKRTLTKHVLVIDWQLFIALREIRAIPLLDLDLQFLRDGKMLPVHIPAAEVIVSPLLPTKMDPAYLIPKADVAPMPIRRQPYLYTLEAGLIGMLLASLYLVWHMGWIRPGLDASLPFRQAWHSIRKLRKQAGAPEQNVRQAMVLLSRAFDQYAGRSISNESLKTLFIQHPELQAQQLAIVQFYQDTQSLFFAGGAPAHSLEQIEHLVRQLSRRQVA